jgi:hypothetical protein
VVLFPERRQWQALKDHRARHLSAAQQRTVDRLARQLQRGRPACVALRPPHDAFFGAARDPALELPALQAMHAQLIAQEEQLLERLCARSGVAMPPGRPKPLLHARAAASLAPALPLKRALAPPSSSSSSSGGGGGVSAAHLIAKAKKRRTSLAVAAWRDRKGLAVAAHANAPLRALWPRRGGAGGAQGSASGQQWEDLHLSTRAVPWLEVASQLSPFGAAGAHRVSGKPT